MKHRGRPKLSWKPQGAYLSVAEIRALIVTIDELIMLPTLTHNLKERLMTLTVCLTVALTRALDDAPPVHEVDGEKESV